MRAPRPRIRGGGRARRNRAWRAGSALVVWLAVCLGAVPSGAQTQPEREPQPEAEERLRQSLRKLDRWDVMQLLRTERDVDRKQKQRAQASAHPEELALLADDEDGGVRFYVAVNPNTPLDVLILLAGDPLGSVRAGVAMSLRHDPLDSDLVRGAKDQLARQMASDGHPLVRLALAGNAFLPPGIADLLAIDADPVIRWKLAESRSLPQSALRILAQDTVATVQGQALRHRNMPRDVLEALADAPSADVRLAVRENPSAPASVLQSGVDDPDVRVRRQVAAHPVTPLLLLRRLAGDADTLVVVAVAEHPHADRELLLELSTNRDMRIRQAAQQHLAPLLRGEIRDDVLERWDSR